MTNSNYISIEQIRESNAGKFAKVSKLDSHKYVAFHGDNAVTGMCSTIKECIADLKELGYTNTSSNRKAQ